MQIRTTKPTNNKFYITRSRGGYSLCIEGSPRDSSCNVLANCVGYACGRFNEIIGSMKYPTLNCNAEKFIDRAKSLGLQTSNVPTLGGIMVWAQGSTTNNNDGCGHVAVVERIIDSNTIYTSESSYGGSAFYNATRRNSNGRWGLSASFNFIGCIINPAIGDVHYVSPTNANNTYTVKHGDNLTKIANMFKTTVEKLVNFNGIKDKDKIYEGQKIVIPGGSTGGDTSASVRGIVKGRNYKCKYNMFVHSAPNDQHATIKKYKDLSANGKENAIYKLPGSNAVYRAGTVYTAQDVITNDRGVYAKTPSGYVCMIGANGTIYYEVA